jgi:hypothetical protein
VKASAAVVIAALSGCAAGVPDEPLAVPPIPPAAEACASPVATAGAPAAPSTPATVATRDYRRAEAKIAPAVTGDGATVGYIKAIDRADKLARAALTTLVGEDGHATTVSIAAARKSLDDLIAALEDTETPPAPAPK